MMHNQELSLIALIAVMALIPFLFASGTCFLKFSVVFVLLRNAIGMQQVPSNMVLNSIALMLAAFVMQPVITSTFHAFQETDQVTSMDEVGPYLTTVLTPYRQYLTKYADKELVEFFQRVPSTFQNTPITPGQGTANQSAIHQVQQPSLYALLPAYGLTELRDAFRIGFYLYLPFVIIDLIVSNVLLALGMMMMSPVTISMPIKLILFVALDGWTLVSKDLMEPYMAFHSVT